MLSSVRCDTVCRNGNTGVVNGVVIPAISIQTIPYPVRTTVLSVMRPTMPRRGPKLCLWSCRAARGWPSRPEILELLGLKVEDRDLVVLFG